MHKKNHLSCIVCEPFSFPPEEGLTGVEYCLFVSIILKRKRKNKAKIDAYFMSFQGSVVHCSRKLNNRNIFM